MFKFHYHNRKKSITGNNCSGLQNGVIRGLQIGAGLREYKSEQEGLQIGVILVISRAKKITNRGEYISNRERDYRSGQGGFQLGQGLQIGESK